MLTNITIIYLHITLLIYSALAYTTGSLIIKQRFLQSLFPGLVMGGLFQRLVYGTVILTVLSALFLTKGYTVYIGLFIAIGIFILVKQKKRIVPYNNPKSKLLNPKQLAILWLVATIFFFVNLLFYRSGGQTLFPHPDYIHYGIIIENLKNGIEGFNLMNQQLGFVSHSAMPYHYFELWFSVIPDLVLNQPVWTFVLITIPLLTSVVYFGFAELTSIFIKPKLLIYFLPFFFLLLCGINNDWLKASLARNAVGFITDIALFTAHGKKYAVIYIFSLIGFISLAKGNIKSFFFAFSLAAFFYPTLIVGWGLLLFSAFIFFSFRTNYNWSKVVIVNALVSLAPFVFYALSTVFFCGTTSGSETAQNKFITFNYGLGAWYVIITIVAFAPFLFPILFNIRNTLKQNRLAITLVLIILTGGLLGSVVFNFKKDTIQLFSNTLPIFMVLFAYLFIKSIQNSNHIFPFILIGFLSGLALTQSYKKQMIQHRPIGEKLSGKEIEQLNSTISKINKKERWGYIWSNHEIEKLDLYNNYDPGYLASYLYLNGYMYGINMSNISPELSKTLMDAPFQSFRTNEPYPQRFKVFSELYGIKHFINREQSK